MIEIADDAFHGCASLLKAGLPNSLKTIGNCAFAECEQLESIMIPDSVEIIEESAFMCCTTLRTVTIGCGVKKIGWDTAFDLGGDNPFLGCDSLQTISVSLNNPTLTTRDGVLFSLPDKRLVCYPPALTQKVCSIPDGTVVIGKYAFAFCKNLHSVNIPMSVRTIEYNAFEGGSLEEITIPGTVEEIRGCAFSENTGLVHVTLSDGIEEIGFSAFSGCTSLTEVRIPESVTKIEHELFEKCRKLEHVTIPGSITCIENMAFSECESLTAVMIPEGVKSIGAKAFNKCSSLQIVTLHQSIETLGEMVFAHCDRVCLQVAAGSYAERYAKEKGLQYLAY